MIDIHKLTKLARSLQGYTQDDLVQTLRPPVTRQALQRHEAGRGRVSRPVFYQIAERLKLNPEIYSNSCATAFKSRDLIRLEIRKPEDLGQLFDFLLHNNGGAPVYMVFAVDRHPQKSAMEDLPKENEPVSAIIILDAEDNCYLVRKKETGPIAHNSIQIISNILGKDSNRKFFSRTEYSDLIDMRHCCSLRTGKKDILPAFEDAALFKRNLIPTEQEKRQLEEQRQMQMKPLSVHELVNVRLLRDRKITSDEVLRFIESKGNKKGN